MKYLLRLPKANIRLAKADVVAQRICWLECVELLTHLCDLCCLFEATRDGCLAITHDM